jgi:hypothetical protein
MHLSTGQVLILKRQKKVVATDYPFFVISLYQCTCGCESYTVTLDKTDIGYKKEIFNIEYNTSLEAFVKFEKLVKECIEGKYNRLTDKDGKIIE